MTDKKPVIVYGASGYTGRLVCEYLREVQHALHRRRTRQGPRAGGARQDPRHRDRRLRSGRGRPHEVGARTELFRGAKVVSNMVGPFSKYGAASRSRPVSRRGATTPTPPASRTGCSKRQEPLRRQVRGAGSAHLARRRADVHDRRNRREHLRSKRRGSTRSIFWCCGRASRPTPRPRPSSRSCRRNGTISSTTSSWNGPQSTHYEVNVPGQHAHALVTPWAGTVASRLVSGRSARRQLQGAGRGLRARSDGRLRRDAEDVRGADQAAASGQAAGGARGHRGLNPGRHAAAGKSAHQRFARLGLRVRAARPRAHCVIHGNCNYKQTGHPAGLRRGCRLLQRNAAQGRLRVGLPGVRASRRCSAS